MKLTVFALLLIALAFGVLVAIFRSGFQQFDEPSIAQHVRTSQPFAPEGKKRLQPWLREKKSAVPATQPEDPMVQTQPTDPDPAVDEAALMAWSEELRQREEALQAAESEQAQWVEDQQQTLAEQQQWVDEQEETLVEELESIDAEPLPVESEPQEYVPTPEDLQSQFDAERAEQLEAENAWLLEQQRLQQGAVVFVPFDPTFPQPAQVPAPQQTRTVFPNSGRVAAPISRTGQPLPRTGQPIPRTAVPIPRTGQPIPRQAQPIRRVPTP